MSCYLSCIKLGFEEGAYNGSIMHSMCHLPILFMRLILSQAPSSLMVSQSFRTPFEFNTLKSEKTYIKDKQDTGH